MPASTIRALFLHEQGDAGVIGLPRGFDIREEIRDAESICLATAYARMSGWKYLADAFRETDARTYLLAGLDHFLTQPDVLRQWMQLAENPRVEAKVYTQPTFHPKVLIINGARVTFSGDAKKQFALVGSGNLSEGGLLTNVECSLFTDSDHYVRQLVEWFERLFQQAQTITGDLIDSYEPSYLKARHHSKRLRAEWKTVRKALAHRRDISNNRHIDEMRDTQAGFFIVNTNIRNHEEDHYRMMAERKACAFHDPWKYEIEKLKKGSIVFLYQSGGPGIVAFGKVRWEEPEKRDRNGKHLEAYCMALTEFRRISPPISPRGIRQLDGSGRTLRNTVETAGATLGQKLYALALDRSS